MQWIIWPTINAIIAGVAVWLVKNQLRKSKNINAKEPPHTPFSASAYIDRMEKAYLDTLQERKSEEPHALL